jgi:hypothetical protein
MLGIDYATFQKRGDDIVGAECLIAVNSGFIFIRIR